MKKTTISDVRAVLFFATEGKTNVEIARATNVSPMTAARIIKTATLVKLEKNDEARAYCDGQGTQQMYMTVCNALGVLPVEPEPPKAEKPATDNVKVIALLMEQNNLLRELIEAVTELKEAWE